MRFLHTSDLHIGKKVNEFSMLEDQEHILKQILQIAGEYRPEGILIAGDIYDKGIPGVEAVTLFDWFLTELYQRGLMVFMVSGNHDSSERVEFGGRILTDNKIHIAGTYQGKLEKVTLWDEHGPLNIYLLPFIKPALVRRYYPEVTTYQEAVEAILKQEDIHKEERNILIAHQFITSGETEPERCESETVSIGGLDNIDASVFEAFDYVALGHLHGPQGIGRDTIRYAGSPLKYSFSEARQIKSVTLVEFGKKAELSYSKIPLQPLRDLRQIKGPIEALTDPKVYSQGNTLDYIHATLTDEEEIYDAIGKLRAVYPNIMRLDFENSRTAWNAEALLAAAKVEERSSLELFEEFYEYQNNQPMSEEQRVILKKLFGEMEGDGE
jgi:exonuclease SbcD